MNNDGYIFNEYKRKELFFIKSFGLISLITTGLYCIGYLWRSSYYFRLSIEPSMIEYPFPEILVPKPDILFFIIGFVFIFVIKSYQNRIIEYRAQKMGISYALNKLAKYSNRINTHPTNTGKKNNRVFLLELFIKRMLENDKTINLKDETFEEKLNCYLKDEKNYTSEIFVDYFKDIPTTMAKEFIKYSALLWSKDDKERCEIIEESMGVDPVPDLSHLSRKMRIGILNVLIITGFVCLACVVIIIINNFETALALCYGFIGIVVGIWLSETYKSINRGLFLAFYSFGKYDILFSYSIRWRFDGEN